MAFTTCRRPASHKFVVLSWQRVPLGWPHPPGEFGYMPYEVMCRRCGDTDVFDSEGGEAIGTGEAIAAGLEVAEPDEFDTKPPAW